MADRSVSVRNWLQVTSLLVPIAVVPLAAPAAGLPATELVVWAALLAAGQALRVPGPSGERHSVGLAVAMALPLTIRLDTGEVDLAGLATVYGLGLLASWFIRWRFGESPHEVASYLSRRIVGLAALLPAFLVARALVLSASTLGPDARPVLELISFAVAGLVWYGVETLVRALTWSAPETGSLRYRWLLAVSDWRVVVALVATGALFGFSWPEIGIWAVLVAGLPYAFSHLAFLRASDTHLTYGQTIRALSRIPEVAGLSPTGHGQRVAELSLAIARELGLNPDRVTELEYAALMHDIGRITLNEPSILKMGFTDEDIARWGAEIVGEASYLENVARLVREQHHPYRRPGEERDLGLPLESKIIRAASAFDHATYDLRFPRLEALELLHRGAAYDFDPQVVHALRRVVEREGVLSSRS